jgi:hypothetical protein
MVAVFNALDRWLFRRPTANGGTDPGSVAPVAGEVSQRG